MISTFSTVSSPAVREICNHLWQSTLFAAVVAAIALALRTYSARTRYWLWLAASAKFLIPFSLLIAAGSHFARPTHATLTHTVAYVAINQVSQPFTSASDFQTIPIAPQTAQAPRTPALATVLVAVWLCGLIAVLSRWLFQWSRVAITIRNTMPLRKGRVVETLRRVEGLAHITNPIDILSSPGSMEPGVFGILKPVLLWPEAISTHLDDAHLEAILAHEAAHVRRRDNLTSLPHMLVEAIFWFYPIVWWMESQLVRERERACDEEVLLLCREPKAYAEGILKVCELCIESPLTCISGITGADLKRRIGQIMTASIARKLGLGARLLLLASGIVAVGAPIMLGQLSGARVIAAVKTWQPTPPAVRPGSRAVSQLELESSTPSRALIVPSALREFQPMQTINLAQAQTTPAPASPRLSRFRGISISAVPDESGRDPGPMPGMIASPRPVYPPDAKAAGIQGVVDLNATITSTGTLINIEVVGGPQELRQSAMDAVSRWQFKPLDNGKSSEGDTKVSIDYQLPYQLPGMPPVVGPAPPADEAAAGVKQYGGDITAPAQIYKPDPEYTELARTDKLQGSVTVGLVVDEHGVPQHVQVVRALGDGLDEKAVNATKQGRFKPAMENGKPVPVFLYLKVDFKLN